MGLDRDLYAKTYHAIGAGERVLAFRNGKAEAAHVLLGQVHIVILVVGLEVSSIDFHLVGDLITYAETKRPRVHDERHVVHVSIGESVASELNTAAHLQLLRDIPLGTGQILVGVAIEELLAVLIPVCVGVEEMVVAKVQAHRAVQESPQARLCRSHTYWLPK